MMNKTELKQFIDTKSSGIVMFYSEFCKTCEKVKEILALSKIPVILVSCDEDIDHYITEHKIDLIPHIRIYENGVSVWDRCNVITPEHIEFLKSYV